MTFKLSKRRIAAALICFTLVILMAGVRLSYAQHDELDSLLVCKETEKLVFQNELVRVIETRAPAGNVEPKHRHARGLTISLSEYDSETLIYPGGLSPRVSRRHGSFGEVNWNEPVIHEVRNVGKTEKRGLRIELKY